MAESNHRRKRRFSRSRLSKQVTTKKAIGLRRRGEDIDVGMRGRWGGRDTAVAITSMERKMRQPPFTEEYNHCGHH